MPYSRFPEDRLFCLWGLHWQTPATGLFAPLSCPCGKRGCLETVVSGAALRKACADAGYSDGLSELQSACQSGDEIARTIVHNAANAVAKALEQLVQHFAADVISVGGGVVTALPTLFDEAIRSYTAPKEAPADPTSIHILRARRGDHAGVIGAGLLAVQQLNSTKTM